MKYPITLRLDPGLLAKAKTTAEAENRTLTNFIETLLKQRIAAGAGSTQPATYGDDDPNEPAAHRHRNRQPKKGAL